MENPLAGSPYSASRRRRIVLPFEPKTAVFVAAVAGLPVELGCPHAIPRDALAQGAPRRLRSHADITVAADDPTGPERLARYVHRRRSGGSLALTPQDDGRAIARLAALAVLDGQTPVAQSLAPLPEAGRGLFACPSRPG